MSKLISSREDTHTKLPSLLQDSAGLPIEAPCCGRGSGPGAGWRCALVRALVCVCWLGGGVHMLPAPLPTGDCLLSVLQVCSAPLSSATLAWSRPAPVPGPGWWRPLPTVLCLTSIQHLHTRDCPLCPLAQPAQPAQLCPAHVMRAARSWSQCGLRRAVPSTAFTIYSADCCVF